jgi:hypothetical protein
MILHAHPITASREARGAQPANSVWLWGGGTLPALSQPPYTTVWSNEHLTRALARAAAIAPADLPADGADWLAGASPGEHLIVIDTLSDALRAGSGTLWRERIEAFDEFWLRPLLGALRAKKIGGITLVACNEDSLLETSLARADLRRWWRRARPLSEYAGHA